MVQRLGASLSVGHTHGSCFTLTLPDPGAQEAADEQARMPPRSESG